MTFRAPPSEIEAGRPVAEVDDFSFADRLDAERVLQLYALTPTGLAMTLVVALVAVGVLWSADRSLQLSSWLAALAIVTLGRFVLYRQFFARPRPPDEAVHWETRSAIGAGLAGVAWGALALAVDPVDVTYEILFVLISLGMTSSAAGLLAPSYRALAAFILPLAAGLVAKVALGGDPLHLTVAVFALIYVLFLWRVAFDYHRTLVDNLRRRIADDDLLRAQERIFQSSAVGIAHVQHGTFRTCNARLAELFGYSVDELLNQSTRVLFDSEQRWDERGREADRALDRRAIFEFEELMIRKDGSKFWCLVQGRAMKPGSIDSGAIVTIAEITSLKFIEASLRERSDQYELVVRGSQDGIWDWDVVNDRTYFSPQFMAILGYPPDTDFRKIFHLTDALHPEDRAPILDAVRAHLKGKVPFDYEFRLRTHAHEHVWVHARGQAIWGPDGRATRFAGSIANVTHQRRTKMALEHSESHYRTLVETSSSLIWELDRRGVYTYVNERAARAIFGYEPAEMIGRPFTDFLVTEQTRAYLEVFARLLEGEHVFDFQSRQRRRDGQIAVLLFNAVPLRDAEGAIIGTTGTATDVTRRVEREEALRRASAEAKHARTMLRNAVESLSDGFAWFNGDDRLVLCNRRYAELYTDAHRFEDIANMTFEELVRSSVRKGEVVPPEFEGNVESWIAERVARHRAASGATHRYRLADGRWIQVTERRTPDGGIVGVRTDITELKQAEEEIRRLADLDPLTGLPNRRLLEDRLGHAIRQAKRRQQMIAVLLIDLDNFKPINDQFGHRVGDAVLIEVARRLQFCVRGTDTVARYGGDEFVVVLPEQQNGVDAETIAGKIHSAIAMPFRDPVSGLQLSCSIGISLFPEHGDEVETLLRQADESMYQSKRHFSERSALH